MNTEHSIPPLRDLPSGRFAERKQHLLAEITREREPRLSPPTFTPPRVRTAMLAAAALIAALVVAPAFGLMRGCCLSSTLRKRRRQ